MPLRGRLLSPPSGVMVPDDLAVHSLSVLLSTFYHKNGRSAWASLSHAATSAASAEVGVDARMARASSVRVARADMTMVRTRNLDVLRLGTNAGSAIDRCGSQGLPRRHHTEHAHATHIRGRLRAHHLSHGDSVMHVLRVPSQKTCARSDGHNDRAELLTLPLFKTVDACERRPPRRGQEARSMICVLRLGFMCQRNCFLRACDEIG